MPSRKHSKRYTPGLNNLRGDKTYIRGVSPVRIRTTRKPTRVKKTYKIPRTPRTSGFGWGG